MVVSKKCKICSVLDSNNVSISGDYFGKLIPDLIMKICGVELDSRKAAGVLICQMCVIQLVHTDVVIEKVRNAMQRLKKNVKNTKSKTPSKDSTLKNNLVMNKSLAENDKQQQGETNTDLQSFQSDVKSVTEKKQQTAKKIIRRNSVFQVKNPGPIEHLNHIEEVSSAVSKTEFKKILDDVTPSKTPATKTKRKATPNNGSANDIPMDQTDAVYISPMKSNKAISVSVSEESPMDVTFEEHDGNEASCKESKLKIRNCILCGEFFHSKLSLRHHIEIAHVGQRLKTCPYCSSEFQSQQKYDSHVFSKKCKNIHECQYPKCNKRFKTVERMELHMQETHTSINNSRTE